MIKKVDHVILVVNDIETSLADYQKMLHLIPEAGAPESSRSIREMPLFRVVMLPSPSGARIELIEPKTQVDSRFSRFLQIHGEGVFGISFFIDDFDTEIDALKSKGTVVEVETQSVLYPEYPFRIAWVPPEEGHGVWLEFVDLAALPPGKI
jgi:hypothetical protein